MTESMKGTTTGVRGHVAGEYAALHGTSLGAGRSKPSGGKPRLVLNSLLGLIVVLWGAALMAGCTPQQRARATEMSGPGPVPATTAPAPTPSIAGAPAFRDLADFQQQLAAAATGGDVEPFWQTVVELGHMPLIFGETAVFLYRGPGQPVIWRGDFTRWDRGPALPGERQGETDIWMASREFPSEARLDYKVVVNGGTYLLDPLNPETQLGGLGPNSVLHMPDYLYPEETLPRSGVAQGKLHEPAIIHSKALGFDMRYQVYTPAGYATLAGLPVIYATDGQDYAHPEMGALPIVLDNLIAAGDIRPVMAIFIDMRNPATGDNRRDSLLVTNDRFQEFLVKELVPAIDRAYRTRAAPEGRAILGTSLGGLHAAYTGLHHAAEFGMAALHSPYFVIRPQVVAAYAQAERLPLKVFMTQGIYDFDVENTRQLADIFVEKQYPLLYLETADGHSWGNWRGTLDDMLRFFFGV